MRFKYYLKGLGMGIIVTTIIMSVSCMLHNNNLSDQKIIEKAMDLGMVMPDSENNAESGLFGNSDTDESQSDSNKESDETDDVSESETTVESETPVESEAPVESETPTESEEPSTQTPPQNIEITQYVLHVVWGDYPRKIATELYEIGMVDDAKAFQKYLGDYCEKKRKEIQVGTYTITKGMTYEEIAILITSK